MPFDRHLIANYKTGLQTDVRQWRLMDDAFHLIKNAYVWRGRVRKRFGSFYMVPSGSPLQSRLRISIGTTNGSGNLSVTVPGVIFAVGQLFSVGTEILTVQSLGTPTTLATTGTSTVHTFNTTTGAFVINGAAATTSVYYYPAQPVMGITQYESGGNINNYPSYAFDPQFAYIFTAGTGWSRSGSGTSPQWNGQLDTNFQNFFWVTNWKGSTVNNTTMFVSNFQVSNKNGAGAATDDPIWYTTDGSTWTSISASAANGFYFLPAGGARTSSPFVVTSRIILPFRNRLILLNTIENNNSGGFGAGTNSWYPQRCRYSFNGSPLANNAWYEPNQVDGAGLADAGAGFIDAPTDEQIITSEFIKDRLIVYFERSTWELAYTGNEQLPFIWNRLNTELGSQSTFSTVPFDKEVLTVGYTGIHACNGSNVQRIDQIIPDEVFDFSIVSNNAIRIAGVRDYRAEMVYWTVRYSDARSTQLFPNRVLVYNYRQPSWAYNDDTITTFGYFEQASDLTWQEIDFTWAETNNTWESSVEVADQILVLAGNQEGFVTVLSPQQTSKNIANLQITNLTNNTTTINLNIVNHNLTFGDWIAIYGSGMTNFNVNHIIATGINNGIYQVVNIIDVNNITIVVTNPVIGTYKGGGLAARVSNIQLQSKQWNPYDKDDRNVFIQRIDFIVQATDNGQITVDYWPSSTAVSMLRSGTGAIMGTGILETSPYDPIYYPLEQSQARLWHPLYMQTDGECIQLNMYLSDVQISNPNIAFDDFELEGMLLFTEPTTDRAQ